MKYGKGVNLIIPKIKGIRSFFRGRNVRFAAKVLTFAVIRCGAVCLRPCGSESGTANGRNAACKRTLQLETKKKGTTMKKSLLLLGMCLVATGAYAQDDDVYFVPSSENNTESQDIYISETSSYEPIADESYYESSNWAAGRGNGDWDVDEYNRRGRSYTQQEVDTMTADDFYQDGYEDGYEDGYYTSRLIRFWSPRVGVYVSSPYYWDYYDWYYAYDPWYYGYGSPWSWGWSGWYGWGSWYGWRPYYSSWYWGWGWNRPWHGGWWGGPSYAWHHHNWLPANAERGPMGGWVARSGSRGGGLSRSVATTSSRSGLGLSNSRNSLSGRSLGTRSVSSSSRSYSNSRAVNRSGLSNSSRSVSSSSSSGSRSVNRSSSRSFNSSSTRSSSSSIGSSSRSIGSSRSISSGSRSFGGGGGRSFGGGGGRSGGRR